MTIDGKTLSADGERVKGMADLQRILLTEDEVARKVAELGDRISADYEGRDLILIGILKGGIVFLSDLSRHVTLPHELDLVGARSYKSGAEPASKVQITKDLDLPVEGRDVLIVEDIYDTGNTLGAIQNMIRLYSPRSMEVCALLSKKKKRGQALRIKYVGFEIEDVFVVGYGLDYKERYRNIPCVGILHPEIYQ